MPDYEPIDYRLRCHTKRTDLPSDVLRDIGEAYAEIERLRAERDEARRRICEMLHEEGYGRSPEEWAKRKGWDCFNTPETNVVKTLNGVIIDAGKAVPPHYEDLDNG